MDKIFSPKDLGELRNGMLLSGIDPVLYGQRGTKSLEDLFAEIRNGECRLVRMGYSDTLCRVVEVVRMDVYCDGWRLVEVEQRFRGGGKRSRSMETSVVEKMKPGETQEEAVTRLIKEEISTLISGHQSVPIYKKSIKEQKTSESYPGLITRYFFHDYDWFLIGINTFGSPVVEESDKTVVYKWVPVPT